MRKFYKLSILPLVAFLSSCGYGLKEYYNGNAYATGDFQQDYYKEWDSRIDLNNPKNKIISSEEHRLDEDNDYVFKNYDDPNFALCDRDAKEKGLINTYNSDYYPNDEDRYLNIGYGPTRKLSRQDNSFRYGYVSKLFDGQMYCHGRYQYARVQIDESGFGCVFSKETNLDTYFALNLKASYDYTKYEICDFSVYPGSTGNIPNGIMSGVDLKVSFYCKTDKGFIKKSFLYEIDDLTTNGFESAEIYTLFGFRTSRYELNRVAGLSIEFTFDREDINKNPMRDLKDKEGNPYKLDYSLMLYEVFMPFTIWK